MFDLNEFIDMNVTKRKNSMFSVDIKNCKATLEQKIENKSVLVIGGAGSIGSSFIKAILPYKPKTLVVVDINENGLAELVRDLRSTQDLYIPDDFVLYPMDYASITFNKMFRNRKGFDIVTNFSAHKHVRSEKDIFSIEALIRNNLLNAKKLLNLLSEFPPKEYFCVSTDKAANPVNIMGASKRIMEDLIFSYSNIFPVKTARFANVAFSNGSLPASFIDRLRKLQPISAPKDVKRYFVSPQESGEICMLACFLGQNREIFFPKLNEGKMMSFDKIASAFLKENGYEIYECSSDQEAIQYSTTHGKENRYYPVHFSISNTSGEKSYEEFYTSDELLDKNRFLSLGIVVNKPIPNNDNLDILLTNLEAAFERYTTKEEIVSIIKKYLPNFDHIETGKSLDSKM